MKARLHALYFGNSDKAHRFRYALLVFDAVTICYVIATSFTHHGPVVEVINTLFGLGILADFLARLWVSTNRWRFLTRPISLVDIVALVSFIAPLASDGFGFLRVLRSLRLLHSYQLSARLRDDFRYFRRNEDVVLAALNLCVFIFVMTGLIYATQYPTNPDIQNYADSLYFTVTALTTTGFGDITLPGTTGRMISVVVMIAGVTLFLRLVQVLFRPDKVRCECETCGLGLHDADAVHCKHCGSVMHIDTEGQT